MSIPEEERNKLADQFKKEIQQEHDLRMNSLSEPRETPEFTSTLEQEAAIAALRQEVRTQFQLDNGYVPYTDSRGLTHLILPEEFARRNSRRRRSKRKPKYLAKVSSHQYIGYLVVLLLGMALGYKIVY